MAAGTQYIENACPKFTYLRDRIDAVEKPDGGSWGQGITGLSEFISAYEKATDESKAPKGSLRTDLSKCNGSGSLSGPKFTRLLSALGLDHEDIEWFKSSDIDTFKTRLARKIIRIPHNRSPMETGALKLVPLSQKDFLGTEQMSFHVRPNTQGSQMEPFLDIFARPIFCAEHDCYFGFTELMLYFEFLGGPTIRLDGLLGDRAVPYETEQIRLTARNPMKPKFNIELINSEGTSIFDQDYFIQDKLGQIIEAHAGDEVRVSLRVRRQDGVLRYSDPSRKPDSALEEIENIIFSNEALKYTPEMNVAEVVSPSEYITLCEQTIEIQHDEKF